MRTNLLFHEVMRDSVESGQYQFTLSSDSPVSFPFSTSSDPYPVVTANPAPILHYVREIEEYCGYCGNVWNTDSRGNCKSCGAPKLKRQGYK